MVSDKYEPNGYEVGDYCIYKDTLYKCIEDHISGQEFETEKWKATKITNEIKNQRLQIKQYLATKSSGILAKSAWRACYSDITTDVLEKGMYLFIFGANITAKADGSGTFRLTVDGFEVNTQRQSISVNTLVMSCLNPYLVSIDTEKKYTINGQFFSTVDFEMKYDTVLSVIKLS